MASNSIDQIFWDAGQIPSGDARDAYLERVCEGDAALRHRVEHLLQARAQAENFLDLPAAGLLAASEEAIRERPGTVIGAYKLLEQIGEGGFGVVFMAEQTQPVRRKVALKIVKPGMDTRQVVARFEAERQALALMDHPNIAHILDGGETASGRPYFVMELVRGIPITEFCDQSHLSVHQRLELFLNVCHAVQHAHHKGIIHRDLKPSNVLVTLHDDKAVVKVIDFGIAKATGQQLTDKTLFTNFAQMIGTPLYMSPEQAQMSGLDVDTRSDIYSLGVLLYELLTGTTPFDQERLRTESYDEIRRLIREEEPHKPSTRLSTLALAATTASANRQSDPKRLSELLRGDLDWIVMKALEKDRNRRYDTANAFALDLQRYLSDEPVQACPPSLRYRLRKLARRHKAMLVSASVAALAAFLMVGVVAGSLGWMARDRSERQARLNREVEHALEEADKSCDQALTLTDNPYHWEAALAVAASACKRADGLAAQEEAGLEPAVHERLEALRARLNAGDNDRRFVARFDEIRLEQSEVHEAANQFKLEIAFPGFKKAFQSHYGIAFGATPPEKVLKIIEQRPGPVRPYLVAALEFSLAFAPTEDSQARAWLGAVLQAVDSSDPWRRQARAAIEARDWHALGKLLEQASTAQQPPVVFLALAAKQGWDDPRMLDLWRYIRQAYASDFWANHSLAHVLHYYHGRLEEAIRYYTAAIALRPRSPADYINMGNALHSQGQLDQAIAFYRQATAIAPRNAAAHERLGLALEKKGCLDEAIAELRATTGLRNYVPDHNSLGRMLARKGLLDEAIAAWKRAIQLDPKDAVPYHRGSAADLAIAYCNLGSAWGDKGQQEEAIAAYHKAIQLNPKYARAYNDLSWQLLVGTKELRDPKAALLLARKAVELEPQSYPYVNTLGVALYRNGEFQEAIPVLHQSLAAGKGAADAFDLFFLAMCYHSLGEPAKARDHYDRADAWFEQHRNKLPAGWVTELTEFQAEARTLLALPQASSKK
jgi:serine/threonine protein kinase/tetratricopeptide (TPR) repeat protein